MSRSARPQCDRRVHPGRPRSPFFDDDCEHQKLSLFHDRYGRGGLFCQIIQISSIIYFVKLCIKIQRRSVTVSDFEQRRKYQERFTFAYVRGMQLGIKTGKSVELTGDVLF